MRRALGTPVPPSAPLLESFPAAVLLADISGFTPLAERFGRRGPIGAEELSVLLNTHFGELIALVRARGGDVISVAGDALLAVWPAADDLEMALLRAAECGLAAQRLLHGHEVTEGVRLAVRIGIAGGDVRGLHVGGHGGRWHFVLAGAAVAEVAAASLSAGVGEVAIGPKAWNRICHGCLGRPVAGGSALLDAVTAVVTPPRSGPSPVMPAAEPALRAYVADAVLSRLAIGQRDWFGELRRVTAVFAGVPGLDHTGPGALAQAQQAIASAQAVLDRYDGTLKEFVVDDKGPTLVAVFGLPPRSHEDDAARAVEAALALRDALRQAGVSCAIGIASGRAFCGTVGGAGRHELAIIGEVMNVAARLMQAAKDDVLCDDATRRATRDRIVFEGVSPLTVKGKAEPLVVYRPRGRAPGTVPTRSLYGRAAEKALLAERVQALQRGEGSIVILEGEPGIGKSRLVADFLDNVRAAGMTSLVGHGDAIERVTPYHAWRPAFEALFERKARPDLLERLDARWSPLAPLLNSVLPLDLPDTVETSAMTGQVRADNAHDLLVHVLEVATSAPGGERRPLVVVMEDAHWLDSASWALAGLVCQRLHPLLFVLVTRPLTDAPSGDRPLLGARGSHRVRLERIPREALAALVRERLGVDEVPDGLVDFVEERADGNPFYTEELVHALREAGAVRLVDGRCELAPGADLSVLPIPPTVEGIVASRIDSLEPSEQLVLKVASVIGRLFAVRLLRAVYPPESDRDRIARDLATLERGDFTRVATPEPELAYLFKHAITQEVAYNVLLFAQRRQLHRAIAEWYERVHAEELASSYPLLAHHWARAEEPARALTYLERAGQHALQEGAYQEAARFLTEALAIADRVPAATEETNRRRGRLARALGEAYLGLGQLTDSRRALERSIASLGSPVPRGRLSTAVRLGKELAVQALHRLWSARFTGSGQATPEDLVEAARAHVRLAELCYFANETLPMLYAGLRGLNLADGIGPSPELAPACANAGYAMGLLRLRQNADAYLASARDVASRVAQPSTRSLVLRVVGAYATGLGAFAAARHALEQAVEIADRLGDRRRWIESMCLLSTIRHYEGKFTERVEIGEKVLYASARRSGDFQAQAWGLLDQIESLLPLGRLEEALSGFATLRPFLHANIGRAEEIWAHGLLATARLQGGDPGQAQQAAARALERMVGVRPTAVYTLEGYAGVAETYLTLWRSGDRSATRPAHQACAALHQFAQVFPIGEPRAWLCHGVAAWLAGRRDRARRAWQKSLAAARRLAMPYEQALAHRALGRSLAADDAGQEHVATAHALLTDLGAAHDRRSVLTALEL